jgi:hypothetical protein
MPVALADPVDAPDTEGEFCEQAATATAASTAAVTIKRRRFIASPLCVSRPENAGRYT